MESYICPNCHKIFEEPGVCKECGAKRVPLKDYLNLYENKVQQKINAVEDILKDLDKVYKNAIIQKF